MEAVHIILLRKIKFFIQTINYYNLQPIIINIQDVKPLIS